MYGTGTGSAKHEYSATNIFMLFAFGYRYAPRRRDSRIHVAPQLPIID